MIKEEFPVAYAAYNKDINIRKESTSGGIFTVIAEYLISNKRAIVYGAAFDSYFNVEHIRVDSKEDLMLLRGSKYPQSIIDDCYKRVKNDLDDGRVVLFVGSPCQVAGLKSFMKYENRNLYTIDFVCHGVASALIWREYLKEIQKKGKIKNIIFKYKYKGWKNWYFRVEYEKKVWQRRGNLTSFMRSYLCHANIRPSCYECRFKGLKHISDFTISDCWGVAEQDSAINDNMGLSALLLQNERAIEIYRCIIKDIVTKKFEANTLMKKNWTTFRSVQKPSIRYVFFKRAIIDSSIKALKIYFSPSIKRWIVYYIDRLKGIEK